MALTIDGSDPTGDLGDLLAAKLDYPSGGSNGDLLAKDGTGAEWIAVPEAGLTLITTETFSAVSSVSLNGCFSATYTNYRVMLIANPASGSVALEMRLRESGADNTTANAYLSQRITANSTTLSASLETDTKWRIGAIQDGPSNTVAFDILQPFIAVRTTASSHTARRGSARIEMNSNEHNQDAAYDGFTLLCAATISGTIRVYGYRD